VLWLVIVGGLVGGRYIRRRCARRRPRTTEDV